MNWWKFFEVFGCLGSGVLGVSLEDQISFLCCHAVLPTAQQDLHQQICVLTEERDLARASRPEKFISFTIPKTNMSNEKRAPGCLVYIGEYTTRTQLYRDYNKPL